jgi:allophanate hydrolase
MSGLALNYQMQESHARYLYTTRTAVNYRLYAFENMDPPRPGMVRSGEGKGIEVEVWEMPALDFGTFVSRIPSPLGIGTIQLENGDAVKGFLCEQIAVQEARDITSYGSWRVYIKA